MRVLILDSDSPLGQALTGFLEQLGRHELVPLSRAQSRWKSERQAKKAVRRAECDVVVDIRVAASADGGHDLYDLDLKRCHWVAKAIARDKLGYLFVSSSRVFSGELGRPYKEDDELDGSDELAELQRSAEQIVREQCEQHLIIRLGPIFSSDGPSLVTNILGQLVEGEPLKLDNNLAGAPVSSADGARVISAILDQLSTQADLWGTYHYGSSDTATYFEFAETVLAAASQFSEFSPSVVEPLPLEDGQLRLNRSLDCAKIRNTFAVKQLTWRNAIADLVKDYYEQQS